MPSPGTTAPLLGLPYPPIPLFQMITMPQMLPEILHGLTAFRRVRHARAVVTAYTRFPCLSSLVELHIAFKAILRILGAGDIDGRGQPLR